MLNRNVFIADNHESVAENTAEYRESTLSVFFIISREWLSSGRCFGGKTEFSLVLYSVTLCRGDWWRVRFFRVFLGILILSSLVAPYNRPIYINNSDLAVSRVLASLRTGLVHHHPARGILQSTLHLTEQHAPTGASTTQSSSGSQFLE